ncbi:hypothetical protein THRCLA_11802 [Thraustotheca clavata]|uniref:M96 mating-specific protein family n=1 Tax=Thraustotheca clavata TaxID=74557 RepID=A0A1V9Y6K6_9STRA|nr:hypothetical protein THRCLA_11802 [Thraustotheca clavata]
METWNDSLLDGMDFSFDDAQLLASLCNTITAPSEREKQRNALQAHRRRQAAELAYLKTTVDELQARLQQLNQAKELQEIMMPPSRWERLAKEERRRQMEASQENRRLKAALEEQVLFAESLAKLVHKKPRLQLYSTEPSEAWKQYKLVSDPALRTAAFHAIVDRDYAITTSVFIQARIHDRVEPFREHVPIVDSGFVLLTSAALVRWQVDFNIAASAIWDVISGVVDMSELQGTYQQIFKVDENVSYIKSTRQLTLGRLERRIIVKRYIENPCRWVIVCRGIQEDEALPLDSTAGSSEEVLWIFVEKVGNDTVAKYCRKGKPPSCVYPLGDDAASICQYLVEVSQMYSAGFESKIMDLIEAKTLNLA